MERTRSRSSVAVAQAGRGLVILVAAGAILSACASPGATVVPATQAPATAAPPAATATAAPMTGVTLEVTQSATLGAFVVGEGGKSLYVFADDADGKSNCTGNCAGSWPPLTVAAAADAHAGTGVTGTVGTITRDDGTLQVTLGGAPLYYFAGDSAAGDTTGQGVGGVWNLASPAGTAVTGEPAAATEKPAPTECDSPSCY